MGLTGKGHLRVLGGEFGEVLLDTLAANKLEFRDQFGDLHTLIFRQFTDDMWCMVNKNDPDWDAHLVRMGYREPDEDIRSAILKAGK